MKAKAKLIISALAVFAVAAAIVGTVAFFSKTFASDQNVAGAAVFDVDVVNANGQTIGDGQFDLGNELYPGMEEREVYQFQVNKNNTKLSVEYDVNLTLSGELFPADNSSPVVLTLQQQAENAWIDVDHAVPFTPLNDTENYRILVSWPHSDHDIDFQAKSGNVKLDVVATQVDLEVEEPEGPPYYTGAVLFKATPNGATFSTSDKEIDFYVNDAGFRVIEIKMGEGTGNFEDKVGKVTITEEIYNEVAYFRVVTEKEYYASPTQVWRSRVANLDTSEPGIVRFPATGAPYLSIESSVLYNWIK